MLLRIMWFTIGVIAGVAAYSFATSEDWALAAAAGVIAALGILLALFSGRSSANDETSTPSEDGTPREHGVPVASATAPPASTP
ncbi:hypothetical protein BH10ACT3_BH10ACT3_10970 [soil metagenome]